jgi:hypothetical protein
MKRVFLLLKSAFFFLFQDLIPLNGSFEPNTGRAVQQEGDVWPDLSGCNLIQGFNPCPVDLPPVSLISGARVTESVTDDDLPLFEGGDDHLLDVLRPGRFIEEKFRQRGYLTMGRGEKDFPDGIADGTSARFPGEGTGNPLPGQISLQAAQLGGLSTPFHSFKRDEERGFRFPLL